MNHGRAFLLAIVGTLSAQAPTPPLAAGTPITLDATPLADYYQSRWILAQMQRALESSYTMEQRQLIDNINKQAGEVNARTEELRKLCGGKGGIMGVVENALPLRVTCEARAVPQPAPPPTPKDKDKKDAGK